MADVSKEHEFAVSKNKGRISWVFDAKKSVWHSETSEAAGQSIRESDRISDTSQIQGPAE
jgi:hypothetical protein